MSQCFKSKDNSFAFYVAILIAGVAMVSMVLHVGTHPSIWQTGLYRLHSKCMKLLQTVRVSTPISACSSRKREINRQPFSFSLRELVRVSISC